MTNILVVIEISKGKIMGITKECLTVAKKLSDHLGADIEGVILGQNISDLAIEATKYGVKKIYKVDDALFAGVNILYHTRTLEALINEVNPSIVIAGASLYGQEVIPRLAARLGSALFASVTDISVDGDNLIGIHPLFEEKLFGTMSASKTQLNFITILGGNNPEVELDESLTGDISDFSPAISDNDKREAFIEEKIAKVSVDITKAKLIVAGGRGVGNKEKYAVIFEAAKTLGGEVGASRAAVDADWVPYDHEVGQTGKTITPDIYIACGISGAIQHIVGMRNSKTIIAVNTDEEAPILDVAHYAIIADLHEVLPELLKKV
ncbi:MAG: electron transfer flavoprotein subunit alpha/FixB family protein [Candidatus Heimdallarchaeota archaeon]|nr:MAG: electron transfer flavoprotein subunit alpha/FixB family protein [Candidatus Heimdallarchaeota archaeon]